MFINVRDEHAELVALLIDALEILLVHQIGDGLIRQKRAGSQRANGGQIEATRESP
jgi:hypothetical protein